MFTLIFVLCISKCEESIEPKRYDSLEVCERVAAKALVQAKSDIVKSNMLNIDVRFECRKI